MKDILFLLIGFTLINRKVSQHMETMEIVAIVAFIAGFVCLALGALISQLTDKAGFMAAGLMVCIVLEIFAGIIALLLNSSW